MNPFQAATKGKNMSDLRELAETKEKVATDLRQLAEIMDRLSKRPDDYPSQAAVAIRELNRLKTEVHPSILEASAKLSNCWHVDCSGRPDSADDMLSLELAVDAVAERVKQL